MANSFPGSVKTFNPKVRGQTVQVTDTTDIEQEIVAIETILINGPLRLGNSTVNTTIASNGTSISVGANVVANTSAILVGNSTVNAVMTSSQVILSSVLGLSANTTNKLENRGGQLFFNGQRVELVGEYPAVYGYVLGGFTGAGRSDVADRITFSSGVTSASTTSKISDSTGRLAAVSDTQKYGYISGGTTTGSISEATSYRITFSTSVTSAASVSNLSQGRDSHTGMSDGVVYGYMMGGQNSSSFLSSTDRLDFATGIFTINSPSALSQQRWFLASISDGAAYGYAVGGVGNDYNEVSSTDRIVFSTSVMSAATISNLNAAGGYGVGLSDSRVYGYVVGGYGLVGYHVAERLSFSTGAFAVSTVSSLSPNTNYITSASSDGETYGYASGGTTGSKVATTHRLTYSTGASAASTISNLSQARSEAAGLSDGAV